MTEPRACRFRILDTYLFEPIEELSGTEAEIRRELRSRLSIGGTRILTGYTEGGKRITESIEIGGASHPHPTDPTYQACYRACWGEGSAKR